MDFLDIDWVEWLETEKEDINHSSVKFIDIMNELLDQYVTLKKLTQKQFKQRFKPWITDKILDKILLRKKFLSRSATCKMQTEKSTFTTEFYEKYFA